MRTIALFISFIIFSNFLKAQGWERLLIEENPSYCNALSQFPDGDILVAGYEISEITGNGYDIVLIRVNMHGDTIWTKTIGGSGADIVYSINKTLDGGFVLAGVVSGNRAILKLDNNGDTLWTKSHNSEYGYNDVNNCSDGGYIAAGRYNNTHFLLVKTNSTGDTLWSKKYDCGSYERANSVIQTNDGGFMFTGRAYSLITGNYGLIQLKTNEFGDSLWCKAYGSSGYATGNSIIQTSDGNIVISGYGSFSIENSGTLIIKTTEGGDSIWSKNMEGIASGNSIIQTTDNKFVLTGMGQGSWGNADLCVLKTDEFGDSLWTKTFGGDSYDIGYDLIQTIDGGYAIAGYTESFGNDSLQGDIYVIKTDSLGNTSTINVNGYVFHDLNSNDIFDGGEPGLSNWIVKIEPGPIYTISDENGFYSCTVDTGNYTVELINLNYLWHLSYPDSPDYYSISFSHYYDTLSNLNFANTVIEECPFLSVDISTPFLRRCWTNYYYLSYCNVGTADANGVYIEVEFNDEIIPLSSTPEWTDQIGNTLIFNIGYLAQNDCGYITILDSVSCEAELGSTLCVYANIFSDTICLPDSPEWDHSSISVEGWCDGDSLVCFSVTNTGDFGDGDMDGTSIIRIYEDDILIDSMSFQLVGGESLELCFEANGHTIRLEADQRPGHPGNSHPQTTIELCGESGEPITGFVLTTPQDDLDPFNEIDCQIVDSYDPNNKIVTPQGITSNHWISSNNQLEYKINFQNTGTDVAYNIVIRDTLSNYLDPSTILSGVSSHQYSFALYESGIAEWTFSNIMLLDSNTNEALSHGFIKFKINQIPNNSNGTLIENSAGIIFDYNVPVITNNAWNIVYDTTLINLIDVSEIPYPTNKIEFEVFPNPLQFNATISFSLPYSDHISLELFNNKGQFIRVLDNLDCKPNHIYTYDFNSIQLNNGIYYAVIETSFEKKTLKILISN